MYALPWIIACSCGPQLTRFRELCDAQPVRKLANDEWNTKFRQSHPNMKPVFESIAQDLEERKASQRESEKQMRRNVHFKGAHRRWVESLQLNFTWLGFIFSCPHVFHLYYRFSLNLRGERVIMRHTEICLGLESPTSWLLINDCFSRFRL